MSPQVLPPELRQIAGGGLSNVNAPVGIPTTGAVSIVHMHSAAPVVVENSRFTFTVPFDQVVPKPFCSTGPLDHVHIGGPVQIEQHVMVTSAGVYNTRVKVSAELAVTPINVLASPPAPAGPTVTGTVSEFFQSTITRNTSRVSVRREHAIHPTSAPGGGIFRETLAVGQGNSSRYVREEICGS